MIQRPLALGKNLTNVLVVEDDSASLHTICDYLSRAGFSVRTAANGWEALKQFQAHTINVVISEESVPDMDGSSLRERCMLHPETRDVPFIFLVPQGKPDKVIRALRAGVDDCVSRPFDPIVLVARVQAVLDRRIHYERMVRVDPLTRLLNRPTLEEELEAELSRIRRYGRFGTVILTNVDDYKKLNESGGSLSDLLLTCLSGVILTCIRTMDTAGRVRGDQFLLMLPETPMAGAEILANRIHDRMAAIADSVAGYALSFTSVVLNVTAENAEMEKLGSILDECMATARETNPGGVYLRE